MCRKEMPLLCRVPGRTLAVRYSSAFRERFRFPFFFLEKSWKISCLVSIDFYFQEFTWGLRRKNMWVFPKIVVPQNGWFIMENPIKMRWFGGTPIFGNTHVFHGWFSVKTPVFCNKFEEMLSWLMRLSMKKQLPSPGFCCATWQVWKNWCVLMHWFRESDSYLPSMYGIFAYIWLIFMGNVGKYTSPMDPIDLWNSTLWNRSTQYPITSRHCTVRDMSICAKQVLVCWMLTSCVKNLYGCFLKWWYPQIIHFNRVFHYKPLHFEVPSFSETPICDRYQRFALCISFPPKSCHEIQADCPRTCSSKCAVWSCSIPQSCLQDLSSMAQIIMVEDKETIFHRTRLNDWSGVLSIWIRYRVILYVLCISHVSR